MQNISTPLLVVAAALIDSEQRVLLQKRPLNAVHGGLWEFPGGKVEAGESPESALVREVFEELKVDIAQSDLRPLAFASGESEAQPGGTRPLVILLYTCTMWQGQPGCLAGGEIGWFDPAQASTLEMPPLDYPLAARLAKAIARKVP